MTFGVQSISLVDFSWALHVILGIADGAQKSLPQVPFGYSGSEIWADGTCCQLPCAKVNPWHRQATPDLKDDFFLLRKSLRWNLHGPHLTWAQFGPRCTLQTVLICHY